MAEQNNTQSANETNLKSSIRNQRRAHWLDESGRLEEYFQIGRNLITTKKDYFIVLDKYAESGLAPRAFCNKYGIKNVRGFETALKRRCEEDASYDEKVKLALMRAEKHAISMVTSVITDMSKNSNALGDAIRSGKLDGVNIDKFILICEKLDKSGTKLIDTMTKLIAKYYYARLNSYKGNSETADLLNLLNNSEIAFILPNGAEKIHEQKSFGVDTYPSEYFIRKMTKLRTIDPKLYSSCVVGKQPTTIESGLLKYKYRFDMDEFLKSRNEYIIDGKVSVVTAEEMQTAVAYAELNNIYPGNGAIREIIKAVKMGKVKPAQELKAKMSELLAEKSKPRPDFESVSDYFNE